MDDSKRISFFPHSRNRTLLNRCLRTVLICITSLITISIGFLGNFFQIATLPIGLFSRSLAIQLNSSLAGLIWTFFDHIFQKQNQANITFSGVESLPVGENAIVVSNHCSFADFFLIHSVARKKRMLSACKYFVKDSIKYVPIFGWGMWLMGMFMLKRNWQKDQKRFEELFRLYRSTNLPVYLVLFLEGSRISPAKMQRSRLYAQEQGLPVLDHVLLPRCKGFIATVRALKCSSVKYIYDFTLSYYHRTRGFGVTPSLLELLTAGIDDYHFHVHVDRIPIADLPLKEEQLAKWVFDRFKLKNDLLKVLKSAFEKNVVYKNR